MLVEIIFILMFLSANGHHLLLMTLSRSYDIYTVGTVPDISQMTTAIVQAGSVMFIAALRLAAPVLAAFLILLVILAVLARCAPEMNILFISLPIRIGLGIFMTMMMMPFINGFVGEFADWMNKILPL
jgi:flagellar biosynthetic protein FliR